MNYLKRMKLSRLLNTIFATVVKDALEKGELNRFNVETWTKEYNGGMSDETLEREVWTLIKHFN